MRILAGGPVRECESAVFGLYDEFLRAQRPDGCVFDVKYELVRDDGGPRWHGSKIDRVAKVRQGFVEALEDYDAVFMVDSDLILGPGVLEALLERSKAGFDVVYGVFWSRWEGFDAPQPQVWDIQPFGHSPALVQGLLGGLRMYESRFGFEMDAGPVREVAVGGGGACTLFTRRAVEAKYWPRRPEFASRVGTIWEGEDRSYCQDLIDLEIAQIAVAGLPIVHLDTPQKTHDLALAEARSMVMDMSIREAT